MQISLELNNILEGGSGIGFIEMIGATEKSDNGSWRRCYLNKVSVNSVDYKMALVVLVGERNKMII